MESNANRAFVLSLVASSILLVGACSRNPAPTAESQPSAEATAATGAPIATAADAAKPLPTMPTPAPGTVVLDINADDERMQTTDAGTKANGAITATGKAGALVFGPYMELPIGKYSMIVEGEGQGPFTLDVVYNTGASSFGSKEFPNAAGAASGSGSLATLDFDATEQVGGVEFRVLVPEGSNLKVNSYKVVAR